MCSCGEGELPSVSSERWHTARKPHKCCECKEEIKVGERYQRYFGVWDGVAQEFKTCSSCVDVRDEVYRMADYYPVFGSAGCCYIEELKEELSDESI